MRSIIIYLKVLHFFEIIWIDKLSKEPKQFIFNTLIRRCRNLYENCKINIEAIPIEIATRKIVAKWCDRNSYCISKARRIFFENTFN